MRLSYDIMKVMIGFLKEEEEEEGYIVMSSVVNVLLAVVWTPVDLRRLRIELNLEMPSTQSRLERIINVSPKHNKSMALSSVGMYHK